MSKPLIFGISLLFLLITSCSDSSQTAAAQGNAAPPAPAATTAAAPTRAAAAPTAPPPTTVITTVTTAVTTTVATTDTAPVTATSASATGETPVEDSLPLSRTLNILILGSDRLANMPNWRTDVMMVVALDFEQQRIGVISIPRDVYIDAIPNHQPNKMNVIDYLGEQDEANGGGPKLIESIIYERMGIRIDHYLRFDFNSFKTVVNTLNGVEIDVDCPYVDQVINLKPGVQRLTGDQALRYVRSRSTGGDLDRARRQQRIVWAVRNQMLKENWLPRLPTLYQTLASSIQTDVGIVTALRVARFVLSIDPVNVHSFVLSPPQLLNEGWRQGMFVFVPDWPAITTAVQKIFERPPFVETNTPKSCP